MPLITYEFTDVIAYGATHSTLQDAFKQAGAAMNVKLSPDPMPEQAVFVRSDHYAMVKVGVPAVSGRQEVLDARERMESGKQAQRLV